MTKQRKFWRYASKNKDLKYSLADKLKISEILAQILINRGLQDAEQIIKFLSGKLEDLSDPYLLKDMQQAVLRIKKAIEVQEKITIYGDYDVDGVTATALVYRVLKLLGAVVDFYIPDRQNEGYGLNCNAINVLYENKTSLLITVDCGIRAVEEVASSKGKIDIIITDHHQPSEVLPEAIAVINPKRLDCTYPDKNLAGVGVAFKLCQALWQLLRENDNTIFDYLDLVAVGSIADIVPLLGENRIMVKAGLLRLNSTRNLGLKAIINNCNLAEIDAGKVGFVIAPRLNAAGRIGQVTAGVKLLITEDPDCALELAMYIEEQNTQRQVIEKEILAEAEDMLKNYDLQNNKVIVLSSVEWHSGIIGIVASRLLDKYFRPVIIISEKDGIGKGSCRSIPGFDIFAALSSCADLLIKFGGHPRAAGLSINVDNMSVLRDRLNRLAITILQDEDYVPVLNIDATVSLREIDTALLEQLACLEPYGMGNPRPVFVSANVTPENPKSLGKEGRHLKLTLRQEGRRLNSISWEMGFMAAQILNTPSVDIAFVPEINEWQGRRNIQLCVHDIKQTSVMTDGNNRDIKSERTVVGQVYLILKSLSVQNEINCTVDQISDCVASSYGTRITAEGIDLALKILEELNLIILRHYQDKYKLFLLPAPVKKLNIEKSDTFRAGNLAAYFKIGNKNWRA